MKKNFVRSPKKIIPLYKGTTFMISTIIVLLLSTFSTISLHGMEKENNEMITYSQQCQITQQCLEYEKNNFFAMLYNKQLNPAEELSRIEKKFAYHEEKLIKERNKSL